MRTERVLTNLSCNQACGFCTFRRPADARSFVARAAVEARITKALAGGEAEIVLGGGEPTLRNDLAKLVAFARARGAKRVVLETNGALVTAELAGELAAAGLALARVHLSGHDARLDEVTRDPGGFEAARRGLHALLAAGIKVELVATLARSTLSLLDGWVEAWLADLAGSGLPPPRGIVLVAPTESPDAGELLPYDALRPVVLALARSSERRGVPLRFSAEAGVPPCVFTNKERPAHLFSLSPGGRERDGFVRVTACETCIARDRCPGFPSASVARFGAPDVQPLTEERHKRRLSLIGSVDEQIEREMVTTALITAAGERAHEEVIRVVFQCNQACRFCYVSTHLPAPEHDRVVEAIRGAAGRGAHITLSGGEPTLNPRLVDYVRLARSLTKQPIQLQSNAIRLDDASLVARLVEAGLDQAFISLHGATAEVSDRVTVAPGTFVRTVKGLEHLAASRVHLILNFVICETNAHELPAFFELVHARWPTAHVNLSFVAPSTDLVPRDTELVPRYSDIVPHLSRGLELAQAHGTRVIGFESMCGIPLCLVPRSLDGFFALSELPSGFDGGEFVKPEACGRCSLSSRCYGLRRGYVELHGIDELSPVP